MPQRTLIPNIKACVFDAYGTLFDVHSAVGKYYERLGDVADQVSNLWRVKQLEYTRLPFQPDIEIKTLAELIDILDG